MLYPKLDVLKSKVNSKYMLVSLASKEQENYLQIQKQVN